MDLAHIVMICSRYGFAILGQPTHIHESTQINAGIVRDLAVAIAEVAPKAAVLVISSTCCHLANFRIIQLISADVQTLLTGELDQPCEI